MEYVVIFLMVLFSALIKGITGFGFALISLPLLMFYYSPTELIPVLMICNLLSSLLIVVQKKEHKLIDRNYKNLIIFGAGFTIVGVALLNVISEEFLIHIMAMLFMGLSLFSLFKIKYNPQIKKPWYKMAGALCGTLTGCISVSGPPLALFLNYANAGNRQFREVFSWFSLVTSLVALIGYYISGLITPKTIELSMSFLPILFIGSYVGKRLNGIIPSLLFKRISLIITFISCVLLLIK